MPRIADEPGLEGWTIKLKKGITEVASTQTVAGGAYSFTGITPGSYTVEEVSKHGWAQTYPAGNVYTVVVINTDQVTVTKADQTSVTSTEVNFGNVPTASISGMKFEDLNGNGQKDAEEKGLKDWTIRLQSPQITETTTTTGQDGSYEFQNLPPGDYTISEELQSGWLQTSPAGGSYLVKLKDADVSERDFGNRKLVEAFLVQITADPQTVQPGQEITFTITINRQGDILLDSLGAEYTLPKGLKFISSNPSPQSVIENADGTSTLIWTVLAFGSQMAAQTAESQAASANSRRSSIAFNHHNRNLSSTARSTGKSHQHNRGHGQHRPGSRGPGHRPDKREMPEAAERPGEAEQDLRLKRGLARGYCQIHHHLRKPGGHPPD